MSQESPQEFKKAQALKYIMVCFTLIGVTNDAVQPV